MIPISRSYAHNIYICLNFLCTNNITLPPSLFLLHMYILKSSLWPNNVCDIMWLSSNHVKLEDITLTFLKLSWSTWKGLLHRLAIFKCNRYVYLSWLRLCAIDAGWGGKASLWSLVIFSSTSPEILIHFLL